MARTLYSLPVIGVGDKDSSNNKNSSQTSKAGPRSQQAELLGKFALILTDETSMKERKLFDLVNVIHKDVLGSGSRESRPWFGGVTLVLSDDYLQY